MVFFCKNRTQHSLHRGSTARVKPPHRGRDPCLNEPLLGSRLEAVMPSSFSRTPRDGVKYSSANLKKGMTDDGSFNHSPLKAKI